MSGRSFYITTAIDYVNSTPHLGTAYEKIAADVIARYHRLIGDDVLFLMGNDEHSLKVEAAAREQGLDPTDYCDRMEEIFVETWKSLDIDYDDFIRTTQERHKVSVREILTRIKDAGDIEEGVYKGWYCTGCEAFKNEGDLEEGKCPEHVSLEPTWLEEKNYFFRLSQYEEFLLEHYEKNPEFVQPTVRRNEMLEVIRGGLKDISISRESANWGVPVPFDESAVVYVWFDALINYVSGTGWPGETDRFERYWPADLHLIGKDITRFHCIIWPAMLKAAGLELPKAVFGHGFVNMGRDRMSKSQGTRVDPKDLVADFGADAVRYYLLAEAGFGRDLEYTLERLVIRSNADLANGLGNLLSRSISMIVKYRDGVIPEPKGESLMSATVDAAGSSYRQAMDRLDLKGGAEAAMSIVARANVLVDEEAPWTLAKDAGRAERLDRVLYDLAESCRSASVLLTPFMPKKMEALRESLRHPLGDGEMSMDQAEFGRLRPGQVLEKVTPLFPRFEAPSEP